MSEHLSTASEGRRSAANAGLIGGVRGIVATVGTVVLVLVLFTVTDAEARPVRTTSGDVVNVCAGNAPVESAPSAGGVPSSPLVVRGTSRIVVMEYEAWFGLSTGIRPQPAVTTCLQSPNMQAGGGGYDSASPAVIAQHVIWLQQMGIDAVTADLTNNVSCIYDGDNPAIVRRACPNRAFRRQQLKIRDNDIGLYAAWTGLQTRLKIIPLLGGFDPDALTPDEADPQHRSALEKEADDFGLRDSIFPNLSVRYEGKPLMLVYLGTPVDLARAQAIRTMLRVTKLDRRYSFKLIAGYLDSQPSLWANPHEVPTGPIPIAQRFGFWSVVDRLNFWGAPPAPYYPTYTTAGVRVENMTASLATAGQSGWICAVDRGKHYCPDAALRYCGAGFGNGCETGVYETLDEFMRYAQTLQPMFLIVDQFNEFVSPDEGPNPNSNDDVEPTREWGYAAIRALISEIRSYRKMPLADGQFDR